MDNQNAFNTNQEVSAPTTKNKPAKILIILSVVALFALAVGATYYSQRKSVNSLEQEVQSLQQTANEATPVSTSDSPAPVAETSQVSETLPNGKKLTYPLNEVNSRVYWFGSAYVGGPKTVVNLTDKSVSQFLSNLPQDTLSPICGSTLDDLSGLSVTIATLDLTNKAKTVTFGNCIEILSKSSTTYSAEAKKVYDQAQADVDAFVKSATIN